MERARLEKIYTDTIRLSLMKSLGLKNIMQVPEISKIVLNVGAKDADSKGLQAVLEVLKKISGQAPVKTRARKSIAGFKLREGVAIGVMVTLRHRVMYEFLDRLVNLSLPRVRDFQGVSPKFDGRGNYNLGIKEWSIFPEIDYSVGDKVYGLNVTIHTTAHTDEQGFELLKSFGMPFRKA
jgi:large subunit ribosomal protein L5